MDLASLDTVAACNEGTEIELRHPVTNAPLGVFWGILGRDSTAFQAHIRASVNAKMRKQSAAKKRGKDADVPTMEDSEAEGIALLVACSTGWRTGDAATLTFRGAALSFDATNARTVLEALPWIRSQVDEAIGDLENFMQS